MRPSAMNRYQSAWKEPADPSYDVGQVSKNLPKLSIHDDPFFVDRPLRSQPSHSGSYTPDIFPYPTSGRVVQPRPGGLAPSLSPIPPASSRAPLTHQSQQDPYKSSTYPNGVLSPIPPAPRTGANGRLAPSQIFAPFQDLELQGRSTDSSNIWTSPTRAASRSRPVPFLGPSVWTPSTEGSHHPRRGNPVFPSNSSIPSVNSSRVPFAPQKAQNVQAMPMYESLDVIGSSSGHYARTAPSKWFDPEAIWSTKPNTVVSSPVRNRPPPSTSPALPIAGPSAVPLLISKSNPNAVHAIHRDSYRSSARQRGVRKPGRTPEIRSSPSPERKAYHPKAPSGGSKWVMWVGNMPHDTTQEEANAFFGGLPAPATVSKTVHPDSNSGSIVIAEAGILSVFLILQSHCAFVNYASNEHLQNALACFNGRPFRNGGVKLVCRVRRKAEEIKSGVGGQRGLGLHRQWVREHTKALATRQAPSGTSVGAVADTAHARSSFYHDAIERFAGNIAEPLPPRSDSPFSTTSSSTTSTLLATYFPSRFFVLKAMTKSDLQCSVDVGFWATQTHNESVLNQAFRTSKSVYLIFGANKAGEFHGYARMTGPIADHSDRPPLIPDTAHSPRQSSPSLSPFAQHLRDWSSTDCSDTPNDARPSLALGSPDQASSASGTSGDTHFIGSSSSTASPYQHGFEGTDRESSLHRKWGTPFRVDWLVVRGLPFHSTRMLRNSWNKDREVKVSRDGTELEPSIGNELLALWESESKGSVSL